MRTIALSLAAALAVSAAAATQTFAAKEKFQRTKPHVNIGTIGHVDRNHKAGQSGQSDVQFEIQLGTSDLQNAESVRSQAKE